MKVYRAVTIRLDYIDCDVERLKALANLAYRGYLVKPPDLPASAYYELESWRYKNGLEFGTAPKRWLAGVWFPMRIQRRINGAIKGTSASSVVVDFDRGTIKLRSICHSELQIPKWLYERLSEGADVKMALLGLKEGRPHLSVVAEKPYKPIETSSYTLVVDVNSWRHGAVVGLITPRGKMAMVKRLRPNLRKVDTLYWQIVRIERKIGATKRLGLVAEVKRLRREAKKLRRKLYRYLRDFVNKSVHEIVVIALRYKAKIVIDDVIEESRRELLEERLPSRLAKLYLVYIRRFVDLLVNQARWYGLPVAFKRLPSTVCPICGARLEQREGRQMVCPNCGFRANRDEVPIHWAVKAAIWKNGDKNKS